MSIALDRRRLQALIYLWTRDAKMPPNKETEAYVRQHLQSLASTGWHGNYSDKEERAEMAGRLAMENHKGSG